MPDPTSSPRKPVSMVAGGAGSLGSHLGDSLLPSTFEVHGGPFVHAQREEYWGIVNTVGTRDVNDEAKRSAEGIATAHHRSHRIDAKIGRIFNALRLPHAPCTMAASFPSSRELPRQSTASGKNLRNDSI